MNDDLISRQAAIGAIYTSAGTATAIKELKQLPSADVVEVVRCKDCKHNTYCYSEVHMTNKLQTKSICKDIDYCSCGEKRL